MELNIRGSDSYETYVIDESTIGVRPKWISVEDRLPEDYYEYVLVYARMDGDEPCPTSIARQFKGEWEMLNHADQSNAVACGDLTWYMSEEDITHWMPLPKPPREDE